MPATRLALGPLSVSVQAGAGGMGVGVALRGAVFGRVYDWATRRARARTADFRADDSVAAAADSPEATALRAQVATVPDWYHTIDLGHGVATPGSFDHRPHLPLYKLPERLDGQRVLDAGTFDGYWAFEFERRGAAEVVALDVARRHDLDYPPGVRARMSQDMLDEPMGQGFEVAKAILGSQVERRLASVYSLTPDVDGTFDTTHIGNVLVHLRDPALALQRLAAVTTGSCIILETIDTGIEGDPRGALMCYYGAQDNCNWWRFNSEALLRLALDAGFARAEIVSRFAIPQRGGARLMRQVVIMAHKS